MSLDLSVWYNFEEYFDMPRRGRSRDRYSLTFDVVRDYWCEHYKEGYQEFFPTLSALAMRVAELVEEDCNKIVRVTNGHVAYDGAGRGYMNTEDFAKFTPTYSVGGRHLLEGEFDQLVREVITVLANKDIPED